MRRIIKFILSLFPPKHCKHQWRPAATSRGGARYCEKCEFLQVLTIAEFYAQFGRISEVTPAFTAFGGIVKPLKPETQQEKQP